MYTICNNIIENVVTRAFHGVPAHRLRLASPRLVYHPHDGTISFRVLDTGKGLEPEYKIGIGLSEVGNIRRTMCVDWGMEDADEGPFTTVARVTFYAVPRRW
ncbi:MAG: hypothetical protein ACRDGA_00110 [Bacteroidota bacterium]